VDSSVLGALYAEKGVEVWPLFIDYGQLAVEQEWAACRRIMASLGAHEPTRMDLHGYGETLPSGLTSPNVDINRDAFLPARNLLMVVAAAALAFQRGAAQVVIGLFDESARLFPDQSFTFLERAEDAIEEALGLRIRVVAPLIETSKQEVLALLEGLAIDQTYSCHRGGTEPCGECVSCLEITTNTRR
jgi:7-cyano-7-deazaguanine synthase